MTLTLRMKRLAWRATKPLRRPPVRPQETFQRFAIGIRVGDDPLRTALAAGPVITGADVTDARARYVADPFLFRDGAAWHMFFEVQNIDHGRGTIGLATSADGLSWQYDRMVLAEPFHLSYPLVFAWEGERYMVPETWQAGGVRLYRAERYPHRWVHEADLLRAPYVTDSTLFRHEGRWWMFAEMGEGFRYDRLRLFWADDLRGPWREHPASPVVSDDQGAARPAGGVLSDGGRLVRFAQVCAPHYGMRVRAFDILELTPERYAEREAPESPVVTPSGAGWDSLGAHQYDVHRLDGGRWIAAVDGWHWGVVPATRGWE